jgi:hypothetical protein
MATAYFWDGTAWVPLSSGGGGGGTGPQGPPGADGVSITVYGPQPTPPVNPRKGDEWIDNSTRSGDDDLLIPVPTPEPEVVRIKRLPPTPAPVIVYLQ